MPINVDMLGIDRLSVPEKLELIELIWNSLPEPVDPTNVPSWHLAELAKRRAEVEANPGAGKPWQKVLNHLTKEGYEQTKEKLQNLE